MNTLIGQGRSVKTILAILLIAMLMDKFLIAPLTPAVSSLAAIDPMIVFLDIPVGPGGFGLISVFGIFMLLYWLLLIPYKALQDEYAWRIARIRLRAATTGLLIIPCSIVSGGLVYLAIQGYLPKHIRNAIGSIGINADIYTAIPGYERIRLKGSMIMLVFLFIGIWLFRRKMRSAALQIAEAMRFAEAMHAIRARHAAGTRTVPAGAARSVPAETETIASATPYPPLHTHPVR